MEYTIFRNVRKTEGKSTNSFAMPACPSVCPHGKLGSNWKDFGEM
jgi:hypothetical protein